jgi:hypothetical protein
MIWLCVLYSNRYRTSTNSLLPLYFRNDSTVLYRVQATIFWDASHLIDTFQHFCVLYSTVEKAILNLPHRPVRIAPADLPTYLGRGTVEHHVEYDYPPHMYRFSKF